jgi:hypothetical protein
MPKALRKRFQACGWLNAPEIFARSQGRNGGVLGTDSLEDVALLFTLKAVQYIAAQNIDVAAPGDLVP